MSEVVDLVVKVLLALAGAGGIGGAIKYLFFPGERRKVNAQADSVVVGGSKAALALMQESVDYAKAEIAELRAAHEVDQRELAELRAARDADRRRIAALEAALRDAEIPIPPVA